MKNQNHVTIIGEIDILFGFVIMINRGQLHIIQQQNDIIMIYVEKEKKIHQIKIFYKNFLKILK